MAAYIVCVEEADWPIVQGYLHQLRAGGILVPPATAEKLARNTGKDVPDEALLVDYDFGGQADIWVDIALDEDGLAYEALVEYINAERY